MVLMVMMVGAKTTASLCQTSDGTLDTASLSGSGRASVAQFQQSQLEEAAAEENLDSRKHPETYMKHISIHSAWFHQSSKQNPEGKKLVRLTFNF